MTQDDIMRISRELYGTGATEQEIRFAILIAAAEREKLAHWMRNLGYATGHGDSVEDLLDHLGTQIAEGLEAEVQAAVAAEREACAKVCEGIGDGNKWSDAHDCAAAIRARSKT